ncbi:TlpA disulfide reductase family protein [Deinococcus sp. MIMF12]|uniref:TlpA disulfide reductase family protein n=1 Tax=Deinococcus rhizophilus TaxID=3049544 RepID=A0ABT7JDB9_9DEIO|nr:TlpA disulfide reductase family protein [Deinococcus rhizophilus]MDL2343035.1 TlpA disulfide reductase family protein [Deinococcus rhizophilus]
MALLLAACAPEQPGSEQAVGAAQPAREAATNPAKPYAVRIEDRAFSATDLAFYGLMQQLDLRRRGVSGAELAAQHKRLTNVNVRLNHLIELYAMSLLATEKGHTVPDNVLSARRAEFARMVAARPDMQALIRDFGEEKVESRLPDYLRQQALRQRIIDDLLATQRRKTPGLSARELDYTVARAYDDLYQDHIGDLTVDINTAGLESSGAATSTPSPDPATRAPALSIRDASGRSVAAPQPTAGRPLLVNFWATWCAPCREELPLLLEAHESGQYQVLAVNLGESPATVGRYLDRERLTSLPVVYSHVRQLPGWNIPGLPTTSLIGEGWVQRGQRFGPLRNTDPWLQKAP